VINRRAWSAGVLFAVVSALVFPLSGPGMNVAAAQTDAATGGGLVSLDFDDAELADVIDTIARMTNRNFIYDDRVRGRVTIVSPTPIPLDQAYAVFESVLQVKGFTTVETPGGALKVIPLRDAKETSIETVSSDRRPANRDRFVTRLIPLKYVEANELVTTLKPLVSKDAAIAAYDATNTVILTESASNVRRIIQILEAIDVDTYKDEIAVIHIEYADASVLASQISEIYGANVGGSTPARRRATSRSRRTSTNKAAPTVTSGGGANPLNRVRLITDDRTNSLIALAPRSQIEEVRQLVRKLDVPVTGGGEIHVYYLQHADAEELSQTLQSLVSGTARSSTGGGAAPPTGGGAAQAIRTAVTALAEGIRVTADPATNSLVIQARKEGYDALIDVIKRLDVERPQVLVEALIMEADVSDGSELGFNGIYRMFTDDFALTVESLSDAAARGAIAGAGLGPASELASSFASGFQVGSTDPDNPSRHSLQGIIRASANDAGINIISAPHILTSDNEEAEIRIGDNIPIITSRIQSAAGVDTNLSTSVNVERQDIGVTLRVTPQITEGDTLRLDIFQEITDINEAIDVGNVSDVGVPLSNRRIENTVVVADGDTVVIGGLISDRYLDEVNKVPFLGDIPILGWAFKTKIRGLKKVNLLVFLTPHIVRSPEDMEYQSIRKREEFVTRTEDNVELTIEERWQAEKRWVESTTTGMPYAPVTSGRPVRNRVLELAGKHPLERMREIESQQRQADERIRSQAEAAVHAPKYYLETSMGSDERAATDLLMALIDGGYEGELVSSETGGVLLLEVHIGPFDNFQAARNAGDQIGRAHGVTPSVVVFQPGSR
jgi:general secretion pathway protein D